MVRKHDIRDHIYKIDATLVVIDTNDGQVVVSARDFNEHQSDRIKIENRSADLRIFKIF